MEQPIEKGKKDFRLPLEVWRTGGQFTRRDLAPIGLIFLFEIVLAGGDLVEVIPQFGGLVANPLFPYYHEIHDLLALILALYAAHKIAPVVGTGALLWFLVLHIPYAWMVLPDNLPELARLCVMVIAGLLGVRIISIRSRLETRLSTLASELEARQKTERRRADELSILNQIAMVGIEATSIEPLLGNAVQIIDDVLHPDFFGVGLVDESLGVLRIYRSTRFMRGERLTFPLGRGVAGKVIETGQPCRIADVAADPVYFSVNQGTRSELCVPLKVGNRVIGMINLESTQPNFFSEEDESLMMTFAGQLATSIERARLFQAEQRQREEAETLREAGAVVAATLRQDEAIELILQQLARVVPYDSASVMLWFEERPGSGEGYLEIVGGRGWADPSVVIGMRFQVPGDNPNTIVIRERQPYILTSAALVHSEFHKKPHDHIQSWLGVPLIVGDRMIGMLAVDNTIQSFYTPDHARLVTAFANQVAIAVENARLFGRIEQLAIIDSLTGLYNRRHFIELAGTEFQRARRYQRPLALILFDSDHFKKVNDTYSHAAGDQVLQAIAGHCRDAMRNVDIMGRYGGEEFIILLPENDIRGAATVAERLRRCVAERPIQTDRAAVYITISLGIAGLSDDCPDLGALLEQADAAMYAAKSSGRNRVEAYRG
ncbi:MAG: diguanylate cyclase [Chloroflexota bacterium]